jgi:heat shock protein HtpX
MDVKVELDPEIRRNYNFRNALHTVILVGGTAALAAAIAWTVYGPQGLIWAAILGGFGLWTLGRLSPKMILTLYNARTLTPDELPELHRVVRELAARADLTAIPQLYYVQSRMLNAFAVGKRQDSAIAITDGLVRAMTMRQIAAILAHEMSHIRNGDLRVMGLADVLNRITGVMSMMGLLGIPVLLGSGWDIPIIGLLLLIFAPTIGGLLQMALSRAREYDADLDGATLTGDPEGLAAALATLERRQKGQWESLILPGSRLPQPSLLRTHPHTEERIARLLALKPGSTIPAIVQSNAPVIGRSIVPPIRGPRIHWHRMGVWY